MSVFFGCDGEIYRRGGVDENPSADAIEQCADASNAESDQGLGRIIEEDVGQNPRVPE